MPALPHDARSSAPERASDDWRARLERGFESWGRFVVRWRWAALALTFGVTAFCASFLGGLAIDNSTESFLLPTDPKVIVYNEFRERFDRDDRLLVGIRPPEVFDLTFLERLRAFHRDLEREVPYVEEVQSLLNARETRGEGDVLIVGELLETWPKDAADVERLRARVLANPLYTNTLISEDGGFTAIAIKPFTYSAMGAAGLDETLAGFEHDPPNDSLASAPPPFLTAAENDELLFALLELIDRYEQPDFQLYLAGALAMTHKVNRGLERDMSVYMSLSLLAIVVLLFVLFRRLSGVAIPLLVVMLSLITTIGIMVMLEFPASTAVQILPVFLLTVGVCDAIHVLTIVFQRMAAGASKTDAIAGALGHSGLAVLLTSVTTAAGMASFVSADLAPVAYLGVIAPIGVILALVYTLVLLPALISILPIKPVPRIGGQGLDPRLSSALAALGQGAARSPRIVVAAALALFVASGLGIAQIRFSHDGLAWLGPDDPLTLDFRTLEHELGGVVSLELLIDSGRENGLHEPETLQRIQETMRFADQLVVGPVSVGKTTSLVDVVLETHQALNENRPEYRRIPDDRLTVAQELLLFENSGSDDLEQIVDSSFRTARVTIRVPWTDATRYSPFIDEAGEGFRKILGNRDFHLTGLMTVMGQIIDSLLTSMVRSYLIAVCIITPLMILLLGNLRMGLIAMVPNLLPVMATLGLMGWLGIPMDASTVLIGAMVLGIAVDDTIHFMHKFQIYQRESGDTQLAIRRTLETTGAALLFTTIVLTAGFGVVSLGSMNNTAAFGLLAAFATVVAFLADVVLGPALMTLFAKPAPAQTPA